MGMDLGQRYLAHGLLAEDLEGWVPEGPLQAMLHKVPVCWPNQVAGLGETNGSKEAERVDEAEEV